MGMNSIVGAVSRAVFTLSLFLLLNLTFTWGQTTGEFNQTAVLLEQIKQVRDGANTGWILLNGALIFFMQTGFAALEAGSVSKASTKNILLKNAIDCCIGAVLWWAVGFAFSFGVDENSKNGFIGTKYFFAIGIPSEQVSWALWFFQYGFAVTSATIVSGAVAERIRVLGYIVYCLFVFTIVYPLVAHWVWSTSGWISPFNTENTFLNLGIIDYAGDTAVGGFSGLAAAFFMGYRGQFATNKEKYVARFEKTADGKWVVNDFPSSNDGFATVGVLLLWFCWYGFNAGSTLDIVGLASVSGRISVNTTIAAGTAALTSIFFGKITDPSGRWSLNDLLNGILAGLVSITGPCATVTTYGAFIIGGLGGIIFKLASKLLLKLRIDDPLDAFPVHGACGLWGLIAVGFFSTEEFVKEAYKRDPNIDDWGVFYGGNGKQFACQVVGALAVAAWSLVWSSIIFGSMRLIDNRRRESPLFTIREKFEILTFGGAEGGVALDFLPPRKDFELSDIDLDKKKDDSSDSSDSEWDRGSISGKRSHISGNPVSRRSIEDVSSKKVTENRSSLSTPPLLATPQPSESSKKHPDNNSSKGSVSKQPSSARAKKDESSSSSSSSDSEVN